MKSCPQCRLFLEQVDCGGAPVWCCRSCGGAWFDRAAAAALLVGDRAALAGLDAQYAGIASEGAFVGLALTCPACAGQVLQPGPVGGAGFEAPVCGGCGGVWMSARERGRVRGEQSAVATAIPDAARLQPDPEPVRDAGTPAGRALERLLEGNRRFAAGAALRQGATPDRRAEVAPAQNPWAVVVCCADSRVPPEIVFDQGLGDLFVVRGAGQVVGEPGHLSVQLAADHWDVPLVVVLGHSRCGAVKVTIAADARDAYLGAIAREIQPSVEAARRVSGELVDNASRANVLRIAARVRQLGPVLAPRVADGRVRVVAAFYDLDTGLVSVLDGEPEPADDPALPEPTKAAPISPAPADLDPGRVCPRCLQVFAPGVERCDHCGIGLRGPSDTEPCPRCSVRFAVCDPVCRGCGLDLRTPRVLDRVFPLPSASGPPPVAPPPVAAPADERLWCPNCRRSGAAGMAFCMQCGIALVRGDHLVDCIKCQAVNPMSADRCRACGADLHPGAGRGVPPKVRWLEFSKAERAARAQTEPSVGCSSAVLVLAAVLCAASAHAVGLARMLGW